jgi:hypothetical protein
MAKTPSGFAVTVGRMTGVGRWKEELLENIQWKVELCEDDGCKECRLVSEPNTFPDRLHRLTSRLVRLG